MDILAIMDEIESAGNGDFDDLPGKVLYVADNGKNTCRECLENDGEIFDIDDPDLPQLPIHPNCRCKYVSASDPQNDVSEDVERYRIVKALKEDRGIEEEEPTSLAQQIIDARRENSKLREQKLFLLFNGRHLMSSDGKLLLDAVSGQPVSIKEKEVSVNTAASLKTVRKIKFDYSYQRQAIKNEGALPQGLYRIGCEESGCFAKGNLIKHMFGLGSWGSYHWRLIPSQYTDTRGRDRHSFTVHGGAEPGSAGCIDLASGDTDLKKYLDTLDMTSICIYARYPDSEIVVEDTKFIYPNFKSLIFVE